MPHHVALLRAINVGGHVVKMERLRQLFEEMGFSAVTTHIASGNVLFASGGRASAASLERKIETALASALGYDVTTFLRTTAELSAVVAREPFPPGAGVWTHVAFLKEPLGPAQERAIQGFRTATDEFAVIGREVHWLCRTRSSDSEFSGARLEKSLRTRATLRNANTVRTIAEMLAARGE